MSILKIKDSQGNWVGVPTVKGDTGNGISSAILNNDYTLTLTFTDGTTYKTPSIRGEKGEKGEPATDMEIHICSASEYDSTTRIPTITNPNDKTFYLVPTEDGTSPDLFTEWVYVNGAWEMFGSAKIDLSGYLTDVQINGESVVQNGIANIDLTGIDQNADDITELKEDLTATNAELADVRVGANGTTYNSAGAAVRGQISDLKNTLNSVAEYVAPVNLYNKNSPLNIDNYRLQAGSESTPASGSSISHPIKIEAGKTYTFKYSASYYGVTANRIVKYCDKDGNLINEFRSISATDNGTASGTFTVSAEQIAKNSDYVCVNVRMIDKGVMIFAEGDTLPAYSDWFEPYWLIRESALPENLPLPANAQNNLLYGKKVAFTGDSICYGAGAAGGYPAIIGAENGMIVSNTGQTGSTLATGTTVDGGNRGWISQKVGNMPDGYDYYIVEGGVNDAAGDVNVPLGTLSSGYTETLDTTTLYGAMEQICKTLQTTFLGKKYGFLIPHNCYAMSHRWNTEFRPAMKQCLKKWGIPYLDLSDECAQLNNLSALRIYTLNGDGWHPTEEGYRLYYVPKIEAWMKTL